VQTAFGACDASRSLDVVDVVCILVEDDIIVTLLLKIQAQATLRPLRARMKHRAECVGREPGHANQSQAHQAELDHEPPWLQA
jgi:hypothetical protein